MTRGLSLFLGSGVVLLLGCAASRTDQAPPTINHQQLLRDLSVLAADSMEGRLVGSRGSERARRYIEQAFRDAGLIAFGDSYEHEFTFGGPNGGQRTGTNVIGLVRGQGRSRRTIVVSAHYDHLGIRTGRIFNGADDNGSGTAALLELARIFSADPPEHDLIFLATDAEEEGLQGARAFVADPPIPLERIALNINMDMISRSDSVLYAAGTNHYPNLRSPLQALIRIAGVTLRLGHDDSVRTDEEDWTSASDHGPFHQRNIPFIYFGVEDHVDYHRPSDDFSNINPEFYERAVETILLAIRAFDHDLEALSEL